MPTAAGPSVISEEVIRLVARASSNYNAFRTPEENRRIAAEAAYATYTTEHRAAIAETLKVYFGPEILSVELAERTWQDLSEGTFINTEANPRHNINDNEVVPEFNNAPRRRERKH